MTDTPSPPRQRRGFALLSPERRREIAARGGAAVAPANRSFARDRTLAATAGRKGGEALRSPHPPKDAD